MSIPNPGAVSLYKVNLFTSQDAAKILALLPRKSPRVPADRAAVLINAAIRVCLGRIGLADAAPAGELAKWAGQLADTLGRALELLTPSATDKFPFNKRDLIDNYARLFDCGEPSDINAELKRYGFDSSLSALREGIVGLRFLHMFAAHAQQSRRKKRRTHHKDRRQSDPFMLAWAQSMTDLFPRLFDDQPPRSPGERSPFIRFCEGVREHILANAHALADDESLRRFKRTLRGAEPHLLAAFICRNAAAVAVTRPAPFTKQADPRS